MKQGKKVVLGQIGLGNWGPNLLRNFMAVPGCELSLACDLDPGAFERLGLDPAGPAFTRDAASILTDPSIQAVVLATPSETHYRLGREALLNGKDLFVEKPLALSSREAGRLADLASREGRVLMVGHLLMYHPAVTALADEVRRGRIGRIYYIGVRRRALGRIQAGCSVLWDLGPHDLSLVLLLTKETPRRVVSTGQAFVQEGLPEIAFTTVTFDGGLLAHLEESWLSPVRERQLVVVGEKGMLLFDELAADGIPLKFYGKSVSAGRGKELKAFEYMDAGTAPVEVGGGQPLEAECRHFIECVRTRREPLSGGENAVAVLRILEAADRSLAAGGRAVQVGGRQAK